MEKHFEMIHNVFKQQLMTDSFDDFCMPVNDMQRLIGRIINTNPEEPKLSEANIGLLNLSDENGGNAQKIKLQLTELKSYSFFDGEIVVVEGTYDSNQTKMVVLAVHKANVESVPRNLFSLDELQKLTTQNY